MKIFTGIGIITVLIVAVAAGIWFWGNGSFAQAINRPVPEVYSALLDIDGSPPMKMDELEVPGVTLVKTGTLNETLIFSVVYEEETITRISFELQPTASGEGTFVSGSVEYFDDPEVNDRAPIMHSRMDYGMLIGRALSLLSDSADTGRSLTHDRALMPLKTAVHVAMINATPHQLLPTFPSVSSEFLVSEINREMDSDDETDSWDSGEEIEQITGEPSLDPNAHLN